MSGEAFGDEWVVRERCATARRQPEHAIDRRQALQVASEARRIASARGAPQDIEWAIDAEGALWILQARPMTALPPDVSWDPPAPGAYTRQLRFGEWISEPVTPLFESWLLTAMEERTHALLLGGDRAARTAAVPRGRQRLVLLLAELHAGRALARNLPSMLLTPSATRASRRHPPLDRSAQLPAPRAEWREDLQPRYRAAVADAEERVETLAVTELPALIDELAELAGESFA